MSSSAMSPPAKASLKPEASSSSISTLPLVTTAVAPEATCSQSLHHAALLQGTED